MATVDFTITGGGTIGHPAHAIRPYIVQSKIFDAADTNLTANDVIKVIDLPDNSIVLGGCLDVLEAGGSSVVFDVGVSTDIDAFCDGVDGNADAIYNFHPTAAGINTVIATDAIQVKILGADSAVVRFRVIALIADIGDPTAMVQTAAVQTGV
jgi:hypothetical protein